VTLPGDAALQQARRLLDPAVPAPAAATEPGPAEVELAWALKTLCYEAWTSEPAQAVRAAQALQALAGGATLAKPATPAGHELAGLAHWTAGIAALSQGRMAAAVDAFDSAAADLGAAGQPDPAAQTQVPKIMALALLGRHDEAAACAEAAQRQLRALGNLRAASRVSLNLGSLQIRRDAYAEAARHYRDATVLFARIGDHLHSVLADVDLGSALAALGDFDEARRIYARAHMRAGRHGFLQPLALAEESAALLDLARGRYQQALAGLESSRRHYEALGLPHALAIAEKQLADAYLELRLLPEALGQFDAAVERFAALSLAGEQAWALAQRGRTQALLGQAGAARQDFEAAAALFATQGNGIGQASVTLAQAELALAGGDAGAAAPLAAAAVAGFTAGAQAHGLAQAQVLQAQAWLEAGQLDDAATAFARILDAAEQAEQVQVRCLTGLGRVERALGRREAALARFEAAVERFEDQRRALPGDDLRSAFLGEQLRPYQELLRLPLDAGDAELALARQERFRARSLAERLDAGGADPEPEPEGEGKGAPALRERLQWLYRRVQRLDDDGDPSTELAAELRRTERELLEQARRQRLGAPLRPSAAVDALDLAALRKALAPGDALVEFGVLDDELLAWIVRPAGVQLLRQVASWREVQRALRAVHFQMDSLRHGSAQLQTHLPSLTQRAQTRLRQLHDLLWAPLAAGLAPCRRLLLVPFGPLAGLPFAALHDGERPLGERFELAQAPSAQAALRSLRRGQAAGPARRALALGESSRLAHAAAEARFVASLFEDGQALVGEQASAAALQAGAGAVDVLHLACHAQFRSDNPRFSALHLHDGPLTVERAEGLALGPCTVVLSACETGLADAAQGDEMVGLVRAFLVAGAARVVASLWPVDDHLSAEFMGHFYRALHQDAPAAQALQRSQQAMRAAHPHPFHWSAFTLHGAW
jgi:CHAT domain-containing protein/tetratricopeptide (TPR) repeat protein